ncbi:hypothetical protein SAMN04489802_3358 [Pseudomonas chlororaphis]|nr:hypothetical protein SAMN04489802_3358 [Pseudomonas chlororaphis]
MSFAIARSQISTLASRFDGVWKHDMEADLAQARVCLGWTAAVCDPVDSAVAALANHLRGVIREDPVEHRGRVEAVAGHQVGGRLEAGRQ